MQDLSASPASQFFPVAIAVLVGLLAIAFAVVRRMGDGGEAGRAHRFPPHQAPRPVLTAVAALIAIGVGLTIALRTRRESPAGSTLTVAGDTVAATTDAARSAPYPVVMIAIGAIALVALIVTLLRMRDESR